MPCGVALSVSEVLFGEFLAWCLVCSRHFLKRAPFPLPLVTMLECGCFCVIAEFPTDGQRSRLAPWCSSQCWPVHSLVQQTFLRSAGHCVKKFKIEDEQDQVPALMELLRE